VWEFIKQFRELALGVCFGISMLFGAAVGACLSVVAAGLLGRRQPPFGIVFYGTCVGVVLGGAWWKLTRFLVSKVIAEIDPPKN
jgi:hypothetical protein